MWTLIDLYLSIYFVGNLDVGRGRGRGRVGRSVLDEPEAAPPGRRFIEVAFPTTAAVRVQRYPEVIAPGAAPRHDKSTADATLYDRNPTQDYAVEHPSNVPDHLLTPLVPKDQSAQILPAEVLKLAYTDNLVSVSQLPVPTWDACVDAIKKVPRQFGQISIVCSLVKYFGKYSLSSF